MKKNSIIFMTLFILSILSVPVSADNNMHHHKHHKDTYYQRQNDNCCVMPFHWRDNYKQMRKYQHLERVHHHGWEERFPGLTAYKWRGHDQGFWHRGHYVKEAIVLFNNHGELVSVGYMSSNGFIRFSQDKCYDENHDSFFIAMWNN